MVEVVATKQTQECWGVFGDVGVGSIPAMLVWESESLLTQFLQVLRSLHAVPVPKLCTMT